MKPPPANYQLPTGSRGVTVMLVIAFMGIFLLIMGTITGYAFEQSKYGRALYGREQALGIAEAGLEYYRWFLAHNPSILVSGTGLVSPHTYTVNDPEGGTLGSALVTATANLQCGIVQSIDLTSRGTSNLNSGFPRTVAVRHMQPSVATYSYLLNSNVLAGSDRDITGPYFSNGGIRMNGTSHSDVLSPQTTWNCTTSYGCNPAQPTAPGVLGSGSGSALWKWGSAVASIDFTGIGTNLASLKTNTQNGGGLYFAAASGGVDQRGYHLVFKSDGTVDVYRVTSTIGIPAYSDDVGDFFTEYSIINSQTLVGTYTVPTNCSVIFVEDRVWVEGVVKNKVTVVAATPSSSATTPDAYLANNITYATNDGTSGFTLVAEGSALIPLNSPDTMEIHGIFVAQGGHYGRNFYTADSAYCPDFCVQNVNASYAQYAIRTKLTTVGSVVSNLRTGTSWTSGGAVISGYLTRVDSFDQLQVANPPPFTPISSIDYGFQLWREQ